MLQWYQADGTTPLGRIPFGKVGPGDSYFAKNGEYVEVVLKNAGAESVENVVVELLAMLDYPAYEYVLVAEGDTQPGSEAFVTHTDPPLNVGLLLAGGSARLWFDCVVPAYAPRGEAQRMQVRAYGYEGA